MEILEAYDLTGSFRDAAELAGCSHHTVAGHVAARDAGRPTGCAVARPQLIDEYLAKVEEWVEQSAGKIRARQGPRQAPRARLRGLGADHPSGGRGGEEGLPVWAPTRAPALGDRAGDVAAVRLR